VSAEGLALVPELQEELAAEQEVVLVVDQDVMDLGVATAIDLVAGKAEIGMVIIGVVEAMDMAGADTAVGGATGVGALDSGLGILLDCSGLDGVIIAGILAGDGVGGLVCTIQVHT